MIAEQAQGRRCQSTTSSKNARAVRRRSTPVSPSPAASVGFIDDDEEIDQSWYEQSSRVFNEHDVDFIGGPTCRASRATCPTGCRKVHTRSSAWSTAEKGVPFDESIPGF